MRQLGHTSQRFYKSKGHLFQSKDYAGAREMGQWLRTLMTLTSLPEDPGSVANTHMADKNYL